MDLAESGGRLQTCSHCLLVCWGSIERITLAHMCLLWFHMHFGRCKSWVVTVVTVLCNDNILLEFPIKQAVNWPKDNDCLQKLADTTGGKIMFKDRSYNIIVPFVPTATLIWDLETLWLIKNQNKLPVSLIAVVRWIKPAHCCDTGQRIVHALFRLTTPEAANMLIKNGMYIKLEWLCPAKDKKEPLHCLKCQHWGHMARDCSALHNTCSTCAKNHRTNACPPSKTVHCVSCNTEDHTS